MRVGLNLLVGLSLLIPACARPVDLENQDLPRPALGGATCGGSTIAQGATALPSEWTGAATSQSDPPTSVLFSAPSQEDSTATALYVVNADGNRRREIVHGFFDAEDPAVSPNGRLVAFVRQSASLEHPDLMIASIDGSNLRILYQAVDYVNSVSWSPDSRRIAFLADGWVRTGKVDGDDRARLIAEVHDDTADVATDDVGWSPDGSAIAFVDGGWVDGHWLGFPTLTLVAPDGSRRRELVTTTGSFAWSPTSDALAFTNRGISIVPAGGGKLKHLVATPEGTGVTNLSWSPDGRSIVFESGENLAVVQLCRLSIDGDTLTELADCVPLFSGQEVSKDSRTLTFVQSTGTDCEHSPENRIMAVPLAGGAVKGLAEPGGSPQWLPG